MKVTFIRPNLTDGRAHGAMEPLAFAVLAGLTPPGYELELFDERLETVPLDRTTDLVAITVETYTARRAYQIADHYRSRGVPVVMGGYHPSLLPDEALNHADSVVIGDAESLWETVLADARNGSLRERYRAAELPALKGLKFDRSIFSGKRYTRLAPVQYGRGCRFACDFCSIHAFYGKNLRQRPVEEIADEIRALGRSTILFVDDNIFVDRKRAAELFEALIPLNIKWACQVSIDIVADEPLLKLMARSGCFLALIGFESMEKESLRQMKKGWNLRHLDYAQTIARLQKYGIMTYGSFVFGYDNDTTAVFEKTVRFALQSKMCIVNFTVLTPTPATPLYDRLKTEKRLLFENWWTDPGYRYGQAVYEPGSMSVEELTNGCVAARRNFYSAGSILKRAVDFRTNCRTPLRLGMFLSANIVTRRELKNKLGLPLGAAVAAGCI